MLVFTVYHRITDSISCVVGVEMFFVFLPDTMISTGICWTMMVMLGFTLIDERNDKHKAGVLVSE